MYNDGRDPLSEQRSQGRNLDFSAFDPVQTLRDRALSWSTGALNSAGETAISGLVDGARARFNFMVDGEGRLRGEGDVLLPLYDGRYTTVFTQLGARSMAVSGGESDGKDRWIGNFGLGQRWFPAAKDIDDAGDWMIGYNAFFDKDFTRSHRRGGIGVEVQYDWLRLTSNHYFPLSGWTDSYDFDRRLIEERPAEGWDARVKAYLPAYRNIALTGAYTQWYGDHVGMFGHRNLEKDPRVWSYGIEYTPIPLMTGFLTQRSTGRGQKETEFGLKFTWHFDLPWAKQISSSKVSEMRTVSGSRHEFVDRENRIILEYRDQHIQFTISPNSVSKTIDDNGGFIATTFDIQYTVTPSPLIGWKIGDVIEVGTWKAGNRLTWYFNQSTNTITFTWSGDVSGNLYSIINIVFTDSNGNFIGNSSLYLTVNDNI
jgi:hypothetical protein